MRICGKISTLESSILYGSHRDTGTLLIYSLWRHIIPQGFFFYKIALAFCFEKSLGDSVIMTGHISMVCLELYSEHKIQQTYCEEDRLKLQLTIHCLQLMNRCGL